MFNRGILTAFCFSLVLHSAAAYSLYGPWWEGRVKDDPILISYVEPVRPAAKEISKVREKLTPPQIRKAPAYAPAPARRRRVYEPPLVLREPRRQFAVETVPVTKAPIRNSTELLADPQKGKIFLAYFGAIKGKIQHTVRQKYQTADGRGRVALFFVLNSTGRLEAVSVMDRESDADPALRAFAVEALQSSAPFGQFPPGLDLKKISFNVTLSFEEP